MTDEAEYVITCSTAPPGPDRLRNVQIGANYIHAESCVAALRKWLETPGATRTWASITCEIVPESPWNDVARALRKKAETLPDSGLSRKDLPLDREPETP